jgi:hypothetical protein
VPYYKKDFRIGSPFSLRKILSSYGLLSPVFLVIGSIIGCDLACDWKIISCKILWGGMKPLVFAVMLWGFLGIWSVDI